MGDRRRQVVVARANDQTGKSFCYGHCGGVQHGCPREIGGEHRPPGAKLQGWRKQRCKPDGGRGWLAYSAGATTAGASASIFGRDSFSSKRNSAPMKHGTAAA